MSTTRVADTGHVKEQAKEAAGQAREQAEDVARRNPWAVLAGIVAVGFAISRVENARSGRAPPWRGRRRSRRRPGRAS